MRDERRIFGGLLGLSLGVSSGAVGRHVGMAREELPPGRDLNVDGTLALLTPFLIVLGAAAISGSS